MGQEYTPKVLIVDDIPSNIEFVMDVLELEDLQVFGAQNGEEALALAETEKPDIVLLDVSMPEMDGYEVCEKLKANEATQNIPVIFLTARIQQEDIIHGFEVGAVDYIVKPFNFTELISRVHTHIDLKLKTEKLEALNSKLEDIVDLRTQELSKANADLKEANEKLTRAHNELAILDNTKNEFVLHINHELRTPLNGIIGHIEMLYESLSEEEKRINLDAVQELTNRLVKVSELSLLFTELKTSENSIEIQSVDFNTCLDGAIDDVDFSHKPVEIEIENNLYGIKVSGENKLVRSCLSIVIDNAIKYSPVNGKVNISIKRYHEYIEVSVLDEGPGFSQKAMEDLFEFFTADNLNHHSHGFGVGLATAKLILDLIKGQISVSNRDPKGAHICLKFLEVEA